MFRSFNLAKPVHVGRTPDRSFAAGVLLTALLALLPHFHACTAVGAAPSSMTAHLDRVLAALTAETDSGPQRVVLR